MTTRRQSPALASTFEAAKRESLCRWSGRLAWRKVVQSHLEFSTSVRGGCQSASMRDVGRGDEPGQTPTRVHLTET